MSRRGKAVVKTGLESWGGHYLVRSQRLGSLWNLPCDKKEEEEFGWNGRWSHKQDVPWGKNVEASHYGEKLGLCLARPQCLL